MPSARPGRKQSQRTGEETAEQRLDRSRALVTDYRATFGSDPGQRVLAHLLRHCRVLYPSPDQYSEGLRAVGMHIIEMLERDDDALLAFTVSGNTEDLYK